MDSNVDIGISGNQNVKADGITLGVLSDALMMLELYVPDYKHGLENIGTNGKQ